MSNGKNIFLTGITGFLGSFLAVELLKKGHKIYALARGKGNKSAKERVYDALKFAFYEDEWDVESVSKNVEVIQGDIVQDDLGIAPSKWNELVEIIDFIFHSAALTELNVPIEVIRKPNVEGTRHVLNFALECQEKGRLRKFNHISTVYVCGDHEGEFDETMLDVGQGFNNTYEQSKFEAEQLLRETAKRNDLRCSIYRTSLIMGDAKSGKISNFRLFYQPLHYFSKEILSIFPIDPTSRQNLIHVDTVASALVLLAENFDDEVYHLVSPNDIKMQDFMIWITNFFGYLMPKMIPFEEFLALPITAAQKRMISPFMHYFNCKARFDKAIATSLLKKSGLSFPVINEKSMEMVFNYCLVKNFVKKKVLKKSCNSFISDINMKGKEDEDSSRCS